jgi:hypothetical protein
MPVVQALHVNPGKVLLATVWNYFKIARDPKKLVGAESQIASAMPTYEE